MNDYDKMKRKIELLLAKANGTDNEHERDTFTAAAQKMMLRWGIEAADLESRGEVKPEDIVEEHRTYRGGMADSMVNLIHNVSLGMGNLRTFRVTPTNSTRTAYVIGHTTDVSNFWMLLNSLELQVAAARRVYRDTDELFPYLTKWEQHKAERSFTTAFGMEVRRRLYALRQEVRQDATPGAALVLVDKQDRVDDYTEARHSLHKGRGMAAGAGAGAGRAAGARANLGGKAVGGTRKALG